MSKGMDRRDFIKAGAGAFFIATAPSVFGGATAADRLRLAIVGCRAAGRGFEVMKQALKTPGVEIAIVCDVDARAMAQCAEYLVRQGYPKPRQEKDFRKVIESREIDGVISETPDHFHAYSAVMAMRAGKHVYVEKPCAFCPAEGEAILRAWKDSGKVFQMGAQRRSADTVIQAVAAIKAGKLIGEPKWGKSWYMTNRGPIGRGKRVAIPEWLDWDLWQGPAPREDYRDNIVHYNWHWFRAWGTGECGNNSIHFVDLARWCLGEEDYPTSVSSDGGKFWMPADQDWEWPDLQNVTWNYADGKCITWEGVCCANGQPYMGLGTGAMVYGDNGSALFTPASEVKLYDKKGNLVRAWEVAQPESAKITDTNNRSGGGWGDSTPDHLRNFVEAIRANDPKLARANAEIGVKSTHLALVANIAQDLGVTVKLDPKTGRPVGSPAAEAKWSRKYEKGWEVV